MYIWWKACNQCWSKVRLPLPTLVLTHFPFLCNLRISFHFFLFFRRFPRHL